MPAIPIHQTADRHRIRMTHPIPEKKASTVEVPAELASGQAGHHAGDAHAPLVDDDSDCAVIGGVVEYCVPHDLDESVGGVGDGLMAGAHDVRCAGRFEELRRKKRETRTMRLTNAVIPVVVSIGCLASCGSGVANPISAFRPAYENTVFTAIPSNNERLVAPVVAFEDSRLLIPGCEKKSGR